MTLVQQFKQSLRKRQSLEFRAELKWVQRGIVLKRKVRFKYLAEGWNTHREEETTTVVGMAAIGLK